MIDWSQIKQLEEDMGAEDLGEVVEIFLAEVEEALDTFVANPPDAPGDVAAQLHFLKGSAYNLGFKAFGDSCAEGEQAAHGGTIATDPARLKTLYEESKTVFLSEFSKNSSARLELA